MTNIANTAINNLVIRPNYNRAALKSRIVHLGFGAFHRAHQALFTNEMLEKPAVTGEFVKLTCSAAKTLSPSCKSKITCIRWLKKAQRKPR